METRISKSYNSLAKLVRVRGHLESVSKKEVVTVSKYLLST